jgi:Type II intron maturase
MRTSANCLESPATWCAAVHRGSRTLAWGPGASCESRPIGLPVRGPTQAARFLGYEIVVHHNATHRTKGQQSINGSIGLKMPRDVVKSKAASYMRYGKPVHRMERSHDSPFSIVEQHQAEYRGFVEYYRMAYNLHRLSYLKWIMETSMTKTLARKLRISVRKVYKRFASTLQTPDGPRKVLQVKVERPGRRHW